MANRLTALAASHTDQAASGLRFWDPKGSADHCRTAQRVQEGQWVERRWTESVCAEPKSLMDRVYIKRGSQQRDNHNAGGNRGALKVLYLARGVGQCRRRHIEPGKTADSANNEVRENNDVPCPAQSKGKPQNCGRHTKRHNVRQ